MLDAFLNKRKNRIFFYISLILGLLIFIVIVIVNIFVLQKRNTESSPTLTISQATDSYYNVKAYQISYTPVNLANKAKPPEQNYAKLCQNLEQTSNCLTFAFKEITPQATFIAQAEQSQRVLKNLSWYSTSYEQASTTYAKEIKAIPLPQAIVLLLYYQKLNQIYEYADNIIRVKDIDYFIYDNTYSQAQPILNKYFNKSLLVVAEDQQENTYQKVLFNVVLKSEEQKQVLASNLFEIEQNINISNPLRDNVLQNLQNLSNNFFQLLFMQLDLDVFCASFSPEFNLQTKCVLQKVKLLALNQQALILAYFIENQHLLTPNDLDLINRVVFFNANVDELYSKIYNIKGWINFINPEKVTK
ncbi:hypothetical protein CJP74_06645 [Psittacicella melopsittaci]|uniref:Transmembrane protein n=1 Tax=Psittacicella melopsittaci TaxID=2028576 RepID=A0A3A1Y6J4_9GAMM|nr:hypothetical protein [Psittacicella melopsittaci]RIY31674.1 hypothetical protein CJP74_06645 [Psittacicella melopsittaci]